MIERHEPEPHLAAQEVAQGLRNLDLQDQALLRWLIGYVGESLLRDGLSSSEVLAVAWAAFNEYLGFRTEMPNRHGFLLMRTQERAQEYRKLRGIRPAAAPPPSRHVLDAVRTKETLFALPYNARRALCILYSEHGSYEDVANELGVSVAHVERMVRKVLRKLEAAQARE